MPESTGQAAPRAAIEADNSARGSPLVEWLPVLASVLAVAAVAVMINLRKSIWMDESLTMDQTGRPFGQMLELVRTQSNKPPVYYIAVWWWRKVWPSLEGVRVYSTLCLVLAVVVLDRAGQALRLGRGVFSLGVLAAFTAHIAWAATEARSYALALLFIACAIWLFARVWLSESATPRRDSVLFVLACYGALLTFYYSGFVLAGLFLGGLLVQGRRRLVACGAALAALMLPWLGMVSTHASRGASYLPPVSFRGDGLLAPAVNAGGWVAEQLSFAVHRSVPFYDGRHRQEAYLGLLALIFGARLWQARGRLTDVERWASAFFAVSFCSLLAQRYLDRWTVDMRHWLVIAIPALVFGAVMASRLRPDWMARAAHALLLVASLAGFVSMARTERGTADWRSAIAWVMAEERPGQPILNFNYDPLPARYYYRGPNALEQVPVDQATRLDGGHRMELTPAEIGRLHALLSRSQAPDLVFWITERQGWLEGPTVLERYVGPLTVLERRNYIGVHAYRVRLSRPVTP